MKNATLIANQQSNGIKNSNEKTHHSGNTEEQKQTTFISTSKLTATKH